MKETKLKDKFRKKILERFPDIFIYKIPDTMGLGGKRPFDLIIIAYGITICIEFKVNNNPLTLIQKHFLDLVSNHGAISLMLDDKYFDKHLENLIYMLDIRRKEWIIQRSLTR